MALTVYSDGVVTTDPGDEVIVQTLSGLGVFVATMSFANAEAGDVFALTIHVESVDGGGLGQIWSGEFDYDATTDRAWQSIPIVSASLAQVRIEQTVGTTHDFPYTVVQAA